MLGLIAAIVSASFVIFRVALERDPGGIRGMTIQSVNPRDGGARIKARSGPRRETGDSELEPLGLSAFATERRRAGLVWGLFCLLLTLSGGRADDWPRFLGPKGNGVSGETGLLNRFPTNGPVQVWQKTVGTGYSAPSVRDGKLVVFHRQGNEEVVECLDAASGRSRWRHAYASRYQDPYGYNNGPRSSPLLTSNRCITLGAEGKLVCLNLVDGSLVWARSTGKDFAVPEAFFGVGSTPVLEGDLLLVMVGGQPDAGMVAFEVATGKTRWQSVGSKTWDGTPKRDWPGEPPVVWNPEEKSASYSTPVVTTLFGHRLAWCVMRQGLVGLDPTDGRVLYRRWFRARVDDSVNAMTPVAVGDRVLISSAYYRSGSLLLRAKPEPAPLEELWKGTSLEMHWSQPMLIDGHLYGFSGRNEPDAHLRCVEFETGKLKWDRDERWATHSLAQPPVFGRGSLISADGKLIALGEGGLLGLFVPNALKCEEISRWQVPSLHFPCWAGPVLSDKRLYLRCEDRLVCLNLAR